MKFILILPMIVAVSSARKLDEKFAWKELDFAWPSEEAKQEAIRSGKYIESHNLPLGLDIWQDKLFITVPRWKSGVASSLNYVKLSELERSPVLYPYPCWEAHDLPHDVPSTEGDANYGGGRTDAKGAEKVENILEKNNETIVSTFRIRIDECDRLWVMDSGLADILGSPKQLAPNSIAIFDLNTNKLIRRFIIPADQVKEDSFFANIIVDTQTSHCGDAFAYLPDLGSYAVVVYDFKNDHSYRVKHNFFHFDPLQGDLTVAGVNFQWTDGVFGMALGKPTNEHGDRTVYFHALASTKEFSVPNTVLKNETFATSNDAYFAYTLLGDRGPKSQSTAEHYDDKTDVIFYTQINRDAVGCWNINKPFTPENQGLVDSDSDALVFPNDLKVDNDGTLYVLSDRMPLFIYGTLKSEYNYRILTGKTSEIITGTPCA
ncbi:CLUMA_CG001074, isoform A [Clunio marinus]|uniref:CLUMA_CG001074, isoform A n=1 Tax=Clunio marinus TaxID=568069 RepID=A0A1J1HGX8_9DIPT|nr:CLUMA_CG001074, isoform A [Clunio marinus]